MHNLLEFNINNKTVYPEGQRTFIISYFFLQYFSSEKIVLWDLALKAACLGCQ